MELSTMRLSLLDRPFAALPILHIIVDDGTAEDWRFGIGRALTPPVIPQEVTP